MTYVEKSHSKHTVSQLIKAHERAIIRAGKPVAKVPFRPQVPLTGFSIHKVGKNDFILEPPTRLGPAANSERWACAEIIARDVQLWNNLGLAGYVEAGYR